MRMSLDNLSPAFYMMFAVVLLSTTPVLLDLGDAWKSPFLVAGMSQFITGLALGAAVCYKRKDVVSNPVVIDAIKSKCKSGSMLMATLGQSGFAMFALGLVFLNISIAAILYETWPLFFILAMSRLNKDSKRYDAVLKSTLFFVFLAIGGIALVIMSQSDAVNPLQQTGSNLTDPRTLIGVFFVMLSALAGACRAFELKIGQTLAAEQKISENRNLDELVFSVAIGAICHLIAGTFLCLIGVIAGESVSMHQLVYVVALGLGVHPIGNIAIRMANLKTKDLGINALSYTAPLFTLIWLWMISRFNVPHPDFLIIGAMGVVAANLLINAEASARTAYKALVASLLVFGTFVYFHDGFTTNVPLELPVTVFILILAFRVDRLVRRTGQEEEWVIDVFRRLTHIPSQKKPSQQVVQALKAASEYLLIVDHYKSAAELKSAYESLVTQLEIARKSKAVSSEVTEIIRLVDKLAHSQQQGSRPGEIVAIFLAGALIVFGLLAFSGDREVYGEIISFVLSSIVVFLFFNILDLQNDRNDETLVRGKSVKYIVNFGDFENRETQQYISMGTSCAIVVVFVVLFFIKA